MTSNTTTTESKQSWSSQLGACLGGLLLAGCGQKPFCPELGDCGGDLIGNWALSPGHPSCQEDIYLPPTDKRLAKGDTPAARLPPPEPAFSDWCSGLVAGRDSLIHDTPSFTEIPATIGGLTLRYHADGRYDGGFGLTGTYIFVFSAACMRQFGATDGRPAPDLAGMYDPNSTEPPLDLCKQLEVPLAASGLNEGAYRNTTCMVNPDEPAGCLCFYDRAEVFGFAGRWSAISSSEILHLPGGTAPSFPHRTTYCREGDTLEVTGADGAYLLGAPGLRTVSLGRELPTCTDGFQNQDETAIDCGGAVCMPCAP